MRAYSHQLFKTVHINSIIFYRIILSSIYVLWFCGCYDYFPDDFRQYFADVVEDFGVMDNLQKSTNN